MFIKFNLRKISNKLILDFYLFLISYQKYKIKYIFPLKQKYISNFFHIFSILIKVNSNN